jgi:hypothetical protein
MILYCIIKKTAPLVNRSALPPVASLLPHPIWRIPLRIDLAIDVFVGRAHASFCHLDASYSVLFSYLTIRQAIKCDRLYVKESTRTRCLTKFGMATPGEPHAERAEKHPAFDRLGEIPIST